MVGELVTWLLLAGVPAALALTLTAFVLRKHRAVAALGRLAASLGWSGGARESHDRHIIAGAHAGATCRVALADDEGRYTTTVAVDLDGVVPPRVYVGPEREGLPSPDGLVWDLGAAAGGETVPPFFRPHPKAWRLLSEQRARHGDRLRLADGSLHLARRGFPRVAEVGRDLTELTRLAKQLRRLLRPGPEHHRKQAQGHLDPAARRASLAELLTHYADAPETRSAVARAVDDRAPEVAVLAAQASPSPHATQVLARLAAATAGATRLRVQAIEALANREADAHVAIDRALVALLRDDAVACAVAAVRTLARHDQSLAAKQLPALVADPRTPRDVADAARAALRQRGGAELGRLSLAATAAEAGSLSLRR